jgi:hypothetical protein
MIYRKNYITNRVKSQQSRENIKAFYYSLKLICIKSKFEQSPQAKNEQIFKKHLTKTQYSDILGAS